MTRSPVRQSQDAPLRDVAHEAPSGGLHRGLAPSPVGAPSSAFLDTMPDDAVEVRGLTKTYRGYKQQPPKTALDGIDLDIPRGSIFGLLGPNGAGKSTLINILAGLVVKTSGTAKVWGIDIDRQPRQARAAIGVVPQEINMDAFFTPRELLELQAGFYGVPKNERRTDEILSALSLSDKANAVARTLSGGMRRRLLMGKAMVHAPPILVLDEPTAGVDVELRQQIWSHVRALNAAGTTILLTTHYLEEAEMLCDRIAIIDHGKLVACDTTTALVNAVDDKRLTLALAEPITELPDGLAGLGISLTAPGRLVFHYRPSQASVAPMLAAVAAAGLHVTDVTSDQTDLEDIFLRLTGGSGAPG
jgi:ABC-2 type transport system ATP-binding protein